MSESSFLEDARILTNTLKSYLDETDSIYLDFNNSSNQNSENDENSAQQLLSAIHEIECFIEAHNTLYEESLYIFNIPEIPEKEVVYDDVYITWATLCDSLVRFTGIYEVNENYDHITTIMEALRIALRVDVAKEAFDGFNTLYKLLRKYNSENHQELHRLVMTILYNACVNNESNKSIIISSKGLREIHITMRVMWHCCDVLTEACALIANLASGALAHYRAYSLHQEPLLHHILSSMSLYPHFAPLQSQGCAALMGLAWSEIAERQIVNLNGQSLVFLALHNHPDDCYVQTNGLKALASLVQHVDSHIVLSNDRIFGLRSICRYINSKYQNLALDVINNLICPKPYLFESASSVSDDTESYIYARDCAIERIHERLMNDPPENYMFPSIPRPLTGPWMVPLEKYPADQLGRFISNAIYCVKKDVKSARNITLDVSDICVIHDQNVTNIQNIPKYVTTIPSSLCRPQSKHLMIGNSNVINVIKDVKTGVKDTATIDEIPEIPEMPENDMVGCLVAIFNTAKDHDKILTSFIKLSTIPSIVFFLVTKYGLVRRVLEEIPARPIYLPRLISILDLISKNFQWTKLYDLVSDATDVSDILKNEMLANVVDAGLLPKETKIEEVGLHSLLSIADGTNVNESDMFFTRNIKQTARFLILCGVRLIDDIPNVPESLRHLHKIVQIHLLAKRRAELERLDPPAPSDVIGMISEYL